MGTLVSLLALVHAAAGSLAIAAGLAALCLPKTGRWHRRAGAAYFWAMAVVASLAAVLAVAHPDPFVELATVYSFYFPFAGYRAWSRRRAPSRRTDATAVWLLAAASLGFLLLWARGIGPNGPMAILFGLLGGAVAWCEAARLRRATATGASTRLAHAGLMSSAYAATILGFSAAFLPAVWLWPVAIAAPLRRRPRMVAPVSVRRGLKSELGVTGPGASRLSGRATRATIASVRGYSARGGSWIAIDTRASNRSSSTPSTWSPRGAASSSRPRAPERTRFAWRSKSSSIR